MWLSLTPQEMGCQDDSWLSGAAARRVISEVFSAYSLSATFCETTKMTKLIDLPFDVLNIILTFLVMARDGSRDLVRASATCKVLLTAARQSDVLKVVMCQNDMLHGYCEPYHHIDGLLSRCTRAGNLHAEFLLAKAILLGRRPLWTMMMMNDLHNRSIKCATSLPLSERRYLAESLKTGSIADLPYVLFCSENLPNIHESYERLQFTRLVKLFFNRANSRELFAFRRHLLEFVVFFEGYHIAYECGIVAIIEEMCLRFQIVSVLNGGCEPLQVPLWVVVPCLARLRAAFHKLFRLGLGSI